MKRPAIQLYFGDLLKNPRVLRCSWAARGALIWTMSILHDSDEYGAVRWPLAEIAQAVGCPVTLMRELATKGALKGGDTHAEAYRWAPSHAGKRGAEVVLVPEQEGPLWYSSRMVRDEYKRTNRGLGTRFGQPGKLPTAPPNQTPDKPPTRGNGGGDGSPHSPPTRREGAGASSSSSVSSIAKLGVIPTEEGPAGKGNGAVENEASSTSKINGKGMEFDDPKWIAASAITVDRPRREGEAYSEWRDAIITLVLRQQAAAQLRGHA